MLLLILFVCTVPVWVIVIIVVVCVFLVGFILGLVVGRCWRKLREALKESKYRNAQRHIVMLVHSSSVVRIYVEIRSAQCITYSCLTQHLNSLYTSTIANVHCRFGSTYV